MEPSQEAREGELTPWPQQEVQQASTASQTGARQNSLATRFADLLTSRYGR